MTKLLRFDISSNYSKMVFTKEIINKALEYSKSEFGMQFIDEWRDLTENSVKC